MYDYLYEWNRAYLDDIAIEYYGRRVTYNELFRQIDQCCRNLAALGIQSGDVVTIQSLPLPQVIVAMYALNKMGACGNMLYPDAKAEDVLESMEKTDSHVLIVMDKILSVYKIFPASIEQCVMKHDAVKKVAVVPIHSNEKGNITKAFVVLKETCKSDVDSVKKDLNRLLSDELYEYELPDIYEFVDDLPLTGMGKIDYLAFVNQLY